MKTRLSGCGSNAGERGRRWPGDCYLTGMAKTIASPQGNEARPGPPLSPNGSAPPPLDLGKELLVRFNPKLVGFGIASWLERNRATAEMPEQPDRSHEEGGQEERNR